MKQKEIMNIIEEYGEALAENEKEFSYITDEINNIKRNQKLFKDCFYTISILISLLAIGYGSLILLGI